mgnify:FL=1
MLVRYGQHQNAWAILRVDHAIGKPPQSAASNLWPQWVPRLGKLLNKPQCFEDFDQEGIAQPRRLFCVPSDSVVQLHLCWLQQADVHVRWAAAEYFAITSDKATALISPRR